VSAFFICESRLVVNSDQLIQSNENKVEFLWSFVAIRNTSQQFQLEPITKDTVLISGDFFKFYIKSKKPGFIYLIYYSSTDELTLLYPYTLNAQSVASPAAEEWYIPEKNKWFELTGEKGKEKFFLLASVHKLHKLEASIGKYKKADQTKKTEISEEVLSEIRNLRKLHFNPKIKAERPVSMIGDTRASTNLNDAKSYDIANLAVEISTSSFYAKTFTIDHK
jgi:hypothetical protein